MNSILIWNKKKEHAMLLEMIITTNSICECERVEHSSKLLQKIKKKKYDLIFLSRGSHEIVKQIRRERGSQKTPIVFLTAGAVIGREAPVSLSAKEERYIDMLRIPFEQDELRTLLKKYQIPLKAETEMPEYEEETETKIDILVFEKGDAITSLLEKAYPHQTQTFDEEEIGLSFFAAQRDDIQIFFIDPSICPDWKKTLKTIRNISPFPHIILIEEEDNIHTAIQGMKEGVADYLSKSSIDSNSLIEKVNHLRECEMNPSKISEVEHWIDQKEISPQEKFRRLFRYVLEKKKTDGNEKNLLDCFDLSRDIRIGDIQPEIEAYLGINIHELSKGKVLVVEDELITNKYLEKSLGRFYELFFAQTEREVIDCLHAHPDIRLVILDIHLPEAQGNDLYPVIRRINPHLEVVVTTGYQEINIAVDLLKEGSFDYISKPFDLFHLTKTMGRAWCKSFWRQTEKITNFHEGEPKIRLCFLNDLFHQRRVAGETPSISDVVAIFPEMGRKSQTSIPV